MSMDILFQAVRHQRMKTLSNLIIITDNNPEEDALLSRFYRDVIKAEHSNVVITPLETLIGCAGGGGSPIDKKKIIPLGNLIVIVSSAGSGVDTVIDKLGDVRKDVRFVSITTTSLDTFSSWDDDESSSSSVMGISRKQIQEVLAKGKTSFSKLLVLMMKEEEEVMLLRTSCGVYLATLP